MLKFSNSSHHQSSLKGSHTNSSAKHHDSSGKQKLANSRSEAAKHTNTSNAGSTGGTNNGNINNNSNSNSNSNLCTAHFGADSVKMIAESIGIGNLADDAARLLADDVTMRLKCIIQDAYKFTNHGRRNTMSIADIDHALKNKNIPPMLGFNDIEQLPFRFVSSGGRELYFQEEKEVELADIVNQASQAKVPQDVSLKAHWLSIEGVQPAIPDNPPPLSKEQQRLESIDPSSMLKLQNSGHNQNKFISQKKKQMAEVIKVKQYATHELSVEQQLYYKEITEACVGSDETRRGEALHSLTIDSGLHQMLPRLCTFISEGVKVNVVQNNLALLIYLMRMVKALLDNHNLYLEKYLHEIIPSVITCIVSKQLCIRPEQDNHWALRDFGSRLMAQICRNFNTNTNNIQVRVTQLLSQSMDRERVPLPSYYGAIACFCEIGPEVQRTFLLKRLKAIGERLRVCLEGPSTPLDRTSAEHIKALLLRTLPSTIKTCRPPPDILDEYRNDYGYLGPILHTAVVNQRGGMASQVAASHARLNMSGQQAMNIAQMRRLSNQSGGQVSPQTAQQRFAMVQGGQAQIQSNSPTFRMPLQTQTVNVQSSNQIIAGSGAARSLMNLQSSNTTPTGSQSTPTSSQMQTHLH